jgi:dihydrofolate reductase
MLFPRPCRRSASAIPSEGATVQIRLPSISYIVARSSPGNIIGRNNQLPWHLATDLQRFKKITFGNVIIMGRKTFLSIGKPLPGRVNVVLSGKSEPNIENSFWHRQETMRLWAGNRESALFFADVFSIAKGRSDFFVIGGSEMYRLFGDLFNKIYLTEVVTGTDLKPESGDAVFDFKIDNRKWRTIERSEVPAGPKDDYPSLFTVLERRTKNVRYVEVEDYFTAMDTKRIWLEKQLDLFRDTKLQDPGKPLCVPYQYHLFEETV